MIQGAGAQINDHKSYEKRSKLERTNRIKIESREEDTGNRTSRVPKPGRSYPEPRVNELQQVVPPVSVDHLLSEIDLLNSTRTFYKFITTIYQR